MKEHSKTTSNRYLISTLQHWLFIGDYLSEEDDRDNKLRNERFEW